MFRPLFKPSDTSVRKSYKESYNNIKSLALIFHQESMYQYYGEQTQVLFQLKLSLYIYTTCFGLCLSHQTRQYENRVKEVIIK